MLKINNINEREIEKIISTYFENAIDTAKSIEFFSSVNVKVNTKTLSKEKIIKTFSKLVFEKLKKDIEFIASKDPSLPKIQAVLQTKTKALTATMLYRIANFFYYSDVCLGSDERKVIAKQLMEDGLVLTSIDIHPGAKIAEKFFIDHGANVVIGETCEIGSECNLFNNVILGTKNVVTAKNGKRHPTLKNNVTICAGAKILGDITLGDNVFVSPGAIVLDDIEDNKKVLIINQLQIEKNDLNSYLPSQKLVVYGIVPKFKNSFNILGEGFYNPTVLIKLKNNKELGYSITYWDKNKIIIKIKNTVPFEKEAVKGTKIIILSNSDKVIILNNLGFEKTLTSLTD